ncbi:hypothetical protein Tco_1154530 [Tanacetum coccineum]
MEILFTVHSANALKKSDLVWEFDFKMELQQPYPLNAFVVFEIMHDSSTQIDRSLGKIKVPIKHFVSGDGGRVKRVRYMVHLSSGETMGELIVSHQQNIMSPTPMINTGDGELQAYIPTLEVPNDRPRP